MSAVRCAGQEDATYSRFQHHKYHWNVHNEKEYSIYFPAGMSDSIYRYVVKETPAILQRVKKRMAKEAQKELNIVIYPSTDQFYESNIGRLLPSKYSYPAFMLRGTRAVVGYSGSYRTLKYDLEEAIVRGVWDKALNDKTSAGEDDGVPPSKNINTQEIPAWYKEGTIRYFAHGWPLADEDKLRLSFEDGRFKNWTQVLSYHPRLGGQAFCYFLAQQYYKQVPMQIFGQLKKKKSLPAITRLITQTSLDSLFIQCFNFYSNRFDGTGDKEITKSSLSIAHKEGIISGVQLNSSGQYVAYTTTRGNNRYIHINNVNTGNTTLVTKYKLPPWLTDRSMDKYPLLQWDEGGKYLCIAKPRKGKVNIYKYTTDGKLIDRNILKGVDGITSCSPVGENGFLLAAYRKGQSDIVLYDDIHEKYSAITDDEYDDDKPVATQRKGEILFVSYRPLKEEQAKVYYVGVGYKEDTLWQGIYLKRDKEIIPVAVDTLPFSKWDKPLMLPGSADILLTSTASGSEKYILLNSKNASQTVLGKYRPIQYITATNDIVSSCSNNDSIYITKQSLDEWMAMNREVKNDSASPWMKDYWHLAAIEHKEDSLLKAVKDTSNTFLTNVLSVTSQNSKHKKRKKISSSTKEDFKPYKLQLHSSYFTAGLNNDYFINRYQPYASYQGMFKVPEIGGITKGGVTDLFENHHFSIAYSLPVSANGSNFTITYENTEAKNDWGLTYFRKVETLKPDPKRNWVDENGNKYPDNAKVKTHYYGFFIKKPLTYFSYLKVDEAIRFDKTIFLATDKYSLNFLPIKSLWSITTLSYRINKTAPTIPLLFKGASLNANIDLCQGLSQEKATVAALTFNITNSKPLYKYITLVTQLHLGYSAGAKYMLYNIGGKDNNLTPKIDTNTHFSQTAPYAFQTLITPFRGYSQSSVYGSKFLLGNADLYFPIFKTLIPIQTDLTFINNFQACVFTDAVTAGEEWNDNKNNNALLKWSFGAGVRSQLAGYPLRLDVAWPGSLNRKPIWYLSLSPL